MASKLLVAVDFSDSSRLAAHRASLLAAKQGAELELLHVMNGRSLQVLREVLGSSPVEADLLQNAQNLLEELANAVALPAKIKTTSRVVTGKIAEELLAASAEADMLVLGAHGWNPLRDRILGTTAVRLLGRSTCPVLITKCRPHGAYKRVLVPVDFSPYSTAGLRLALRIAPGADFKIVHAFHVPLERVLTRIGVAAEEIQRYRSHARYQADINTDALIKEIKGDTHRFSRAIEQGSASPLIISHESGFKSDLIVIGKHGRSAVEELLLGSVTRHVLAYSKCDVLVVHEERSKLSAF